MLAPGARLLAMAVSRFASLLDGLYADWLDDPVFRPIVDQDLDSSGQTRGGASTSCSPCVRPRRSPPSSGFSHHLIAAATKT